MRTPTRAILIVLDSLSRQLIGPWGGREFDTPNLDRLAARAVHFDGHHTGALPCIPARHDLLCGTWDFLWRPWGSAELWDTPLPALLSAAGVTSLLVTDHPHLFETGGENYHVDFTAWDYQRGHETDPWKTRPDPSWQGAPDFGRGWLPYDNSRGWFKGEEDFPGPRTMASAARWLGEHAPFHDRFFLMIDEFDPHEPFDTPERWARRYDPDSTPPRMIWPPYSRGAVGRGVITADQARQLRAQYGAKLSFIDHHLGRILDVLDQQGLWSDTAVFLTTDHGLYLGEEDLWGKPAAALRPALCQIPLLLAWPGLPPGRVSALTTAVDVFATLAEIFGLPTPGPCHGRSLLPLLRGDAQTIRPWVLSGVWGREVCLITPELRLSCAPAGANAPLSVWSNRWSTMPIRQPRPQAFPPPDHRARLDHMPGSPIPVLKQPFEPGDPLPYWARVRFEGSRLSRWSANGAEEVLHDPALEREMREKLAGALGEVKAPADQWARLGLQGSLV